MVIVAFLSLFFATVLCSYEKPKQTAWQFGTTAGGKSKKLALNSTHDIEISLSTASPNHIRLYTTFKTNGTIALAFNPPSLTDWTGAEVLILYDSGDDIRARDCFGVASTDATKVNYTCKELGNSSWVLTSVSTREEIESTLYLEKDGVGKIELDRFFDVTKTGFESKLNKDKNEIAVLYSNAGTGEGTASMSSSDNGNQIVHTGRIVKDTFEVAPITAIHEDAADWYEEWPSYSTATKDGCLAPCNTCWNSTELWNCTSCIKGWYRVHNESFSCIPCPANCTECVDGYECTVCHEHWELRHVFGRGNVCMYIKTPFFATVIGIIIIIVVALIILGGIAFLFYWIGGKGAAKGGAHSSAVTPESHPIHPKRN